MLNKILVPTDFSESASGALEHAAELAATSQAELLLFHVRDDAMFVVPDELGYVPADFYHREAQQIEQRLAQLQARLLERRLRVRTLHVLGKPHLQIAQLAQREHVDLIIMGTHARGAFERLMLGSVAERVARTSAVPVMVVQGPRAVHAGGASS